MSKVVKPKNMDREVPSTDINIDQLLLSSANLMNATSNLSKSKKDVTCYGRVSKLETMVPEQWWKTVFSDALYLQTDGDVVEDPDITRDELEEIQNIIPDVKRIFNQGDNNDSKSPGHLN